MCESLTITFIDCEPLVQEMLFALGLFTPNATVHD